MRRTWITFASGFLKISIIMRLVAISTSKSKSSCCLSQNFAEFSKYLMKCKAVSAVIPRSTYIISEIIVCGIQISNKSHQKTSNNYGM